MIDLCVDVACGSGQATTQLAEYYNRVIGIDSSEKQLEYASKKGT